MPSQTRSAKARILSSRVVHEGPVFSVTVDQVEEPGGIRARRDVIQHAGSVVILAVAGSARAPEVLLERQYRHATRQFLWELPAGRVEPGENVLAGAKRELLEETGFKAKRWKRIFTYFASPGFLSETMTTYLATELTPGPAHPENEEFIKTRFFPLPSLLAMVDSGRMRDGKTLSAVLWLENQRLRSLGRRTVRTRS
ncbi:MAG: NUDIX hydrolase [Acidobacteriales bacterium]|nr:NUDIX hydrolase [Terriglobales bacterium]